MAPRFSVLLPTHNRADVIGYAIESVLWQSERDFELLIVGDGCTDGTAEVVAGFGDPRIRWFDLPKAPHFGYANRNIVLKQAKGDLVAFIAHDDIWLPDHLELLSGHLECGSAEWAYSRPLWVSTDGLVVPVGVNLTNEDELEYFLTKANSIPAPCVMHRRSCLEAYGYWPEDVREAADWKLWSRIIEGGGRRRLAFCRTPTALHFKAAWRAGRTGFGPADSGLDAAALIDWWPKALKLDIALGVTEQQVFFEAIAHGGAPWLAGLRLAASDALDRIAWTAMTTLMPQRAEREEELRELTQELALSRRIARRLENRASKQQAKPQSLRQELKSVYASRSWRLTRPLRALESWVRGWRR